LGAEGFVKIICGSFCCRVQDPGFLEILNEFRIDLGAEGFVKIICDSFCCRVQKPSFVEALKNYGLTWGRKHSSRSFLGVALSVEYKKMASWTWWMNYGRILALKHSALS